MTHDERMDALEMNHAHSNQQIEELSEVIARQQQEIALLQAGMLRVIERMEGMSRQLETGPADERPPHY